MNYRFIRVMQLWWDLFRVTGQLLYGAWRVFSLPTPIVSIFGGATLPQGDLYVKQAHEIAQKFVNEGMSVLTGGGPGVMEGASCGAIVGGGKKGRSVGIGVRELKENKNSCVQEYFVMDYFFARKWLLTQYSYGFVVFPGGFGTLDELSGVLTLFQTHILPQVPIVLIGVEYWQPFTTWLHEEGLSHGTINPEKLNLFSITDDIDEAFRIIAQHHTIQRAKENKNGKI